jgi:hypothetical protein
MSSSLGIEPVNPQQEEFEKLPRAWAARDQSSAHEQHPSAEELYEAASGNLERKRRLEIIDHVAKCAECTQAWRIALETGVRGEQVSGTRRPVTRRPWHFALAASVILAVGLVTYLVIPVDQGTPQYREGVDPLAPVSAIGSTLPRDQFVLRWSAGPPGTTYIVRLSTADLAPLLVKSDIAVTELVVPGSVLANVKAGEELLWQVEAHLSDGRRVVSQTYVVRVE